MLCRASSGRERPKSLACNGNEDMGQQLHETTQASGLNGQVGSGADAQWKGSRAHSPRRTRHERSRSPRRQPSNSSTNTLGVRYNACLHIRRAPFLAVPRDNGHLLRRQRRNRYGYPFRRNSMSSAHPHMRPSPKPPSKVLEMSLAESPAPSVAFRTPFLLGYHYGGC